MQLVSMSCRISRAVQRLPDIYTTTGIKKIQPCMRHELLIPLGIASHWCYSCLHEQICRSQSVCLHFFECSFRTFPSTCASAARSTLPREHLPQCSQDKRTYRSTAAPFPSQSLRAYRSPIFAADQNCIDPLISCKSQVFQITEYR